MDGKKNAGIATLRFDEIMENKNCGFLEDIC